MSKKITLKEIFAAAKHDVPPLPENPASEALSFRQACHLVRRFGQQDAEVFLYLSELRSGLSKKPMSPGRVWACFNYYASRKGYDVSVQLARGVWLSMACDDLSGQKKTNIFKGVLSHALYRRETLTAAPGILPDEDLVEDLFGFSSGVERVCRDDLNLSPNEIAMIKNMALPVNQVDMKSEASQIFTAVYHHERAALIRKWCKDMPQKPVSMAREEKRIRCVVKSHAHLKRLS